MHSEGAIRASSAPEAEVITGTLEASTTLAATTATTTTTSSSSTSSLPTHIRLSPPRPLKLHQQQQQQQYIGRETPSAAAAAATSAVLDGPPAVQLIVGEVDAGMAMLITQDHCVVEIPTFLLPKGIAPGSIVDFLVRRNKSAESAATRRFCALQDSLYEALADKDPLAPILELTARHNTALCVSWYGGESRSSTDSLSRFAPTVELIVNGNITVYTTRAYNIHDNYDRNVHAKHDEDDDQDLWSPPVDDDRSAELVLNPVRPVPPESRAPHIVLVSGTFEICGLAQNTEYEIVLRITTHDGVIVQSNKIVGCTLPDPATVLLPPSPVSSPQPLVLEPAGNPTTSSAMLHIEVPLAQSAADITVQNSSITGSCEENTPSQHNLPFDDIPDQTPTDGIKHSLGKKRRGKKKRGTTENDNNASSLPHNIVVASDPPPPPPPTGSSMVSALSAPDEFYDVGLNE